jgi:peptide deformylase
MSEIITDYSVLKQVSSRVESVEEARPIIDKLESILKKYPNGYGLSAIQIGIPKRIAIVKYGKHGRDFIHLINPEFIEKGDTFTFSGEGCLSFPDVYMETQRLQDFTIRNDAIDGDSFREEKLYFYHPDDQSENEFESIAVEHEIAHMDGETILDFGMPIRKPTPVVREKPKISRNDPCPCGSGKKFKKCCLNK